MIIGVPREIKNHEYRVGLTPEGASEVIQQGHQVLIETGAGSAIGLNDEDYLAVNAVIVESAKEVFLQSELIVKVKEPQPHECEMLRPGQIIFSFLHLAADLSQAKYLMASGATAIAYETVTSPLGGLPILAPMSEIAGRLSVQKGAYCLECAQGGAGTLLSGVPGVKPAKVCILGGGVVGTSAAKIAMGMGADVTVLDRSIQRLRQLEEIFGSHLTTLYSTKKTLEDEIQCADMVVGAVLVPGAAAPKLITRDMLKTMKPGSVIVDVAIDQGGCFETSQATTHERSTYVVDDVVHYCVSNMPGAVARTSTFALTNTTLPYIQALANKGLSILKKDSHFLAGLNVFDGHIACEPVAKALSLDYKDPNTLRIQ